MWYGRIDNISQNLMLIEFVPSLKNILKVTVIFYKKINKKPTTQGIPKWSPIQVLTLPDIA